jgi:hypothetical protein
MQSQRQVARLLVLAAAVWALAPLLAQAQAVKTMSAGVGQEGRTAQTGYSVRFEFAQVTGPYLANVKVVVSDAGGKAVVDTTSEGPWLFADLVVATAQDGSKQGVRFTVEGGGQQVIRLAWR